MIAQKASVEALECTQSPRPSLVVSQTRAQRQVEQEISGLKAKNRSAHSHARCFDSVADRWT